MTTGTSGAPYLENFNVRSYVESSDRSEEEKKSAVATLSNKDSSQNDIFDLTMMLKEIQLNKGR